MGYSLLLLLWFRKKQKDVKPINKIIPKRARTIIGKSTYIISIPLEINQTTPENYAEPMQVDFEMEYDDEELYIDWELEEIALLTSEDIRAAQGLSFEEMSQVVEVILQVQTTEKKERQTVQTIYLMKQTALFDIMIEQLNGDRQRVADMLSKYDVIHQKINPRPKSAWRKL